MAEPNVQLSHLGEAALLLQSPGPMSIDVQRKYWAMDRTCRVLPEVAETVPGVHSLMLRLVPEADPKGFAQTLLALLRDIVPMEQKSRMVEIPVVYGGRQGEDLSHVAELSNLDPDEVVRRHAAAEYTVFALGSQPGFGYLGGLDQSLATPRRDTPRLNVEAGSVVIGGAQAGVISRASPSGWNIIGHTDLSFFDLERDPPALLAPGDRLRFTISAVLP